MPDQDGQWMPPSSTSLYIDDQSTPNSPPTNAQIPDLDIYHVRRVVAGNPNTPKQVLIRLASDTMPNVRRRIAENPKTPADVLCKLSMDSHSDVRLAVAENPNTPGDVLSTLACDDDLDVRFGVAENPHMPEDILLKLSLDDNPYVRCRALKTLQMMSPETQSRIQIMMQHGYGQSLF